MEHPIAQPSISSDKVVLCGGSLADPNTGNRRKRSSTADARPKRRNGLPCPKLQDTVTSVGGDCAADMIDELQDFLDSHNIIQSTDSPTTTLATTAPSNPLMTDPINSDIVTSPENTMYVDQTNGKPYNDGHSIDTPKQTIQQAIDEAEEGTTIFVLNGIYSDDDDQNGNYNSGNLNNPSAIIISNQKDLILQNYPGHTPTILYDGSAGITIENSEHIEIKGLKIEGPCGDKMSETDANNDRLLQSNLYNGVGIDIISDSHHIRINNNKIIDASSSGVRAHNADYLTIINNEISNNAQCSSDGAPGVLIQDPKPIDNVGDSSDPSDTVKIGVINNQISDNYNTVPFYDPNYDNPSYITDNNIEVPRPNYGTSLNNNGFITDGAGVKIESTPEAVNHGILLPEKAVIQISDNEILRNGMEGIEVSNTDNVQISDNVVAWNGVTSKEAPESRPNTSGISLENSENIRLENNEIYTYFDDDVPISIQNDDPTAVVIDQISSDSNTLCGGSNSQDTIDQTGTGIIQAVSGNCADEMVSELAKFLDFHNLPSRTTDAPTTTLPTTTPLIPFMTDNIVETIEATANVIYVDQATGSEINDGLSLETAKKTIPQGLTTAAGFGSKNATIFVLNGDYFDQNNYNHDNSNVVNENNPPYSIIENQSHLILQNYPGHTPRILYDGEAGISIKNSDHIEVKGFDIVGPCNEIDGMIDGVTDGNNNRKNNDAKSIYSGVGIDINNDSRHIRITQNKIHDASSSGIRANGADYLSIINNEVYQNTQCSSDAGSGILIENPKAIDELENPIKIGVINNIVYDNYNQVPFFDANYDSATYLANNNIVLPRPNYGSSANDNGFIIDGSGIKITSNNADSYPDGKTQVSNNIVTRNGITGITVNENDRTEIHDNIVAWNGMVSKTAPENREDSAGISIFNSEDVSLYDNEVYVYFNDDKGYEMGTDDSIINSGFDNTQCGGVITGNLNSYVTIEGGSCAEAYISDLNDFLDKHQISRTTDTPTTTLGTTAPILPYIEDTIVGEITTDKVLYVDSVTGSSINSGLYLDNAKKTIQQAIDVAEDGTTIFVLNNENFDSYSNPGFENGNNNPTALDISDKLNIILRNYPGHKPIITYDGVSGISIENSNNIEVRGFEIQGPCGQISENVANNNRQNHNNYLSGVGVDIIADSHHIRITHNKIHDSSSSGVRSVGNDYISIINNEIIDNAKCSSDSGAGVLIENPKNVVQDNLETPKIGVINNVISNNFNRVPFYDENYSDPTYLSDNNIELPPGKPTYGQPVNDDGFILDGSGIKITTDKTSDDNNDFSTGSIQISDNYVSNNGVNGIEIENTDDVEIVENQVVFNGVTAKNPDPADRPNQAGIAIENGSENVEVTDNTVKVYFSDDSGFSIDEDSNLSPSSTGNKLCGGILGSDQIELQKFIGSVNSVSGYPSSCVENTQDQAALNNYLTSHNVAQTTAGTTPGTLATTAPVRPFVQDPINSDIATDKVLYVDINNGNPNFDGKTVDRPKQTIQQAVDFAEEGTTIFVLNGDYPNQNYNTGNLNNPATVSISNQKDLILRNYPGHKPIITFDGIAGIEINDSENIEIKGFEIEGPCGQLSNAQSKSNQQIKSDMFNGAGIDIQQDSHHIRITNNKIHDASSSGIRSNKNDYVSLINNEIYKNTQCSSNGPAGIDIQNPKPFDIVSDITKIGVINNLVYDNYNEVPFFDENYSNPLYVINNQIDVPRPNYGTSNNGPDGFITDGAGIKISISNSNGGADSYPDGNMQISDNIINRNGQEGILIENTDRVEIFDNIIAWNGMTPKNPSPEDRPNSVGISITKNSENNMIKNNEVFTYFSDDFGYNMDGNGANGESSIDTANYNNNNNLLCGGKLTDNLGRFVTVSGGDCGDEYETDLAEFLNNHQMARTTAVATTTLATTAPEKPLVTDTIVENNGSSNEIVDSSDPTKVTKLYVDANNGQSYNDGFSVQTAKKFIFEAIEIAPKNTEIFVLNGEYSDPDNFNNGNNDNPTFIELDNKQHLILRNYPGHTPKLIFDGVSGITIKDSSNIEITGLEIEGPCGHITKSDANHNRQIQSDNHKYNNVGIDILQDSHHVKIDNNKIHDASGAGIRSVGNDYLSIINNEIYENAACSSDGAPGVLIQDPKATDALKLTKIGVINNQIHDNFNQVPFFDENYSNPLYIINNQIDLPDNRPNYGTAANDNGFIIDGAGIKIETTPTGDNNFPDNQVIEISDNEIIRNGVEGIEVKNTDHVQISDNLLAWNGITPKDAPENRSNNVGVELDNSKNIGLKNNQIFSYFDDDVPISITHDDPLAVVIDENSSDDFNKICGGDNPSIAASSVDAEDIITAVGGNCAEPVIDELADFLTAHQVNARTTDAPTTTLATTAPSFLSGGRFISDPILPDVVTIQDNDMYVDSLNGQDFNDGKSLDTPKKTINNAIENAPSQTTIYVLNGNGYNNLNFNDLPNSGSPNNLNNLPAVEIKDKTDLILRNYPGHTPKITFDGESGVTVQNSNNIEIRGLEIEGPCPHLSQMQAQNDRQNHLQSALFNGNGIEIDGTSHHIRVTHNRIHGASGSGLEITGSDYISVINNEIADNTACTSKGKNAVEVNSPVSIDAANVNQDQVKIGVINNNIHDNVNEIPFLDPNYDNPLYIINNNIDLPENRPNYGTTNNGPTGFIIDGSGISVTDDSNYPSGQIEISQNKIVRNGISGVEVEDFDDVVILDNVIAWNGMTSKTAPENRPDATGIVADDSEGLIIENNEIFTYFDDDVPLSLSNDDPTAEILDTNSNSPNQICGGNIVESSNSVGNSMNVADVMTSLGSSCADPMADELTDFLSAHQVIERTTIEPTTTLATTAPSFLSLGRFIVDPILPDIITLPSNDLYVDAVNGQDYNDGKSLDSPKKSLAKTVENAPSQSTIFVLNGDYSNENNNNLPNGGTPDNINNDPAVPIFDKNEIVIRNYPGHTPKINFDGEAGFSVKNSTSIEIKGFEINGPCPYLDKMEAQNDRQNHVQSNLFNGPGILVQGNSHHIRINQNRIHDASGSGVLVTESDYISIINNEVSDSTGCSSNGPAAIQITNLVSYNNGPNGAEENIDKIGVVNNNIHDNVNEIPYLNTNYDDPNYIIDNNIDVPRPNYGTTKNGPDGFIVDGSGIKIENDDNYPNGDILISQNEIVRNGIAGVEIENVENANVEISDNTIAWNGMTPKTAPKERPDATGIVLNNAENISLEENEVFTYFDDDVPLSISHDDPTADIIESSNSDPNNPTTNNQICGGADPVIASALVDSASLITAVGGNCADSMANQLTLFLDAHQVTDRTTIAPTTTLATTAPSFLSAGRYIIDPILPDITTLLSNNLYVDSQNGQDYNDGKSLDTPKKTINSAIQVATPQTTVYVLNGDGYNNLNFNDLPTGGSPDNINNLPAVEIENKNELVVRNYPGHVPKIIFDGESGISVKNSTKIEIRGFEIEGVCPYLDKMDAQNDRQNHIQSALYNGNGLEIDGASNQIRVTHNRIHGASGSGVEITGSDYISVINNEVSENTGCSSDGPAAVEILSPVSIDANGVNQDNIKIGVINNNIHDNVNQIPYLNTNYDDPNYIIDNNIDVPRPNYGTTNNGPDGFIQYFSGYLIQSLKTDFLPPLERED